MDDEYLKKVVGEERFYLKIIENEIKDLEEVHGDFTDYLVRKGLEYDRQREEKLSEYD